jgi:hypothetical protein
MVIDASVILRGFFPDEAGQAEAYALIRACAQEEVALLGPRAIRCNAPRSSSDTSPSPDRAR